MRTLYIDCSMGAAGDMLTAALMELLPDAEGFVKEMNELGIPGVVVTKEKSVKCGITGTHVSVKVNGIEEGDHEHHHHDHEEHDHEHHHHDHEEHDHEHHHHDHEDHEHEHHHHEHDGHSHSHHHSSMHDINEIISNLKVSEKVKKDVLAVYGLIAEAESHAHDKPVTEIHFHEVGTMDAVADVTAVCMLMEKLMPEKIVVSPIHVGSGHVKCAHGILPVPAPATAYILKDCPIYGGGIKSELCTPTGAALLKYFATEFGDMPIMRTEAIGYGMGKKDFTAANCVRVLLGDINEKKTEEVTTLSCNIDDMTAEDISFAMDELFNAGAREVFTSPIYMKKNRPGTLLTIICDESKKDIILETVFKHTTTIGVREFATQRYVLSREIREIETKYGVVREKISRGYGVTRSKLEHDDLSKIAKENKLSIDEVRKSIND